MSDPMCPRPQDAVTPSDLVIAEVTDPARWDALVGAAPQGTAFSSWAWLAAAAETFGGSPVRWGAWRGEELVAGASYLRRPRMGLIEGLTPPLSPYGGLVFDGTRPLSIANGHAAADALLARAERDGAVHRWALAPALDDARPFAWRDWSVSVRYTRVVTLSDADAVWRSISPAMRRQIKKGERAGYSLELSEDVAIAVAHYRATFEARSVAPRVPVERMAHLLGAALERRLAELWVLRSIEGAPAASCALVRDARRGYYWLAGTDPAHRQEGAMPTLIWLLFQRFCGELPAFDFVGANIPSVARFKRGFGGELIDYFAVERWRGAVLRTAWKAAGAARTRLSRREP